MTPRHIIWIGFDARSRSLALRAHKAGFTLTGYNPHRSSASIDDMPFAIHHELEVALADATGESRVIWLMLPTQYIEGVFKNLLETLSRGDHIIDASTNFFKDSINRQHQCEDKGIHFIDVGVSGAIKETERGVSLMVGGTHAAVTDLKELFTALAVPDGFGHVGGPGAGHFVKMIHNGIEYGMMGALAEGVNVLHEHQSGLELNIMEALKAYEHGSVISSALTSWLVDAYETPGYLEHVVGIVPKGDTETEMEYVADHNHARVLQAALTQRKLTRVEPSRTGALIAAMREQFGGHKTIHDLDQEDVRAAKRTDEA